jgi:uncharacterized protein YkwD
LRFIHFFPAVALAVTTSSAIPVLAHAAPQTKAAPHSTSSTDAPAAQKQHSKIVDSGVSESGATTSEGPGAGVTTGKFQDAVGRPSPVGSSIQVAVRVLLAALNAVRSEKGLAALSLDPRQSKCSRLHSKHMALNGQISHDQFPTDVCVPHRFAGENVGFDPGSPPHAVLVLHNLMMQEGPCALAACSGETYEKHGHYMNILNPLYRHVGIGIVAKHGDTWLTEDFTS